MLAKKGLLFPQLVIVWFMGFAIALQHHSIVEYKLQNQTQPVDKYSVSAKLKQTLFSNVIKIQCFILQFAHLECYCILSTKFTV